MRKKRTQLSQSLSKQENRQSVLKLFSPWWDYFWKSLPLIISEQSSNLVMLSSQWKETIVELDSFLSLCKVQSNPHIKWSSTLISLWMKRLKKSSNSWVRNNSTPLKMLTKTQRKKRIRICRLKLLDIGIKSQKISICLTESNNNWTYCLKLLENNSKRTFFLIQIHERNFLWFTQKIRVAHDVQG